MVGIGSRIVTSISYYLLHKDEPVNHIIIRFKITSLLVACLHLLSCTLLPLLLQHAGTASLCKLTIHTITRHTWYCTNFRHQLEKEVVVVLGSLVVIGDVIRWSVGVGEPYTCWSFHYEKGGEERLWKRMTARLLTKLQST